MSNPFHIEQTPKGTCIRVGPAHYIFWIEATAAKHFVNHGPSSLHVLSCLPNKEKAKTPYLHISTLNVETLKKLD